jgi:hypothetical protein
MLIRNIIQFAPLPSCWLWLRYCKQEKVLEAATGSGKGHSGGSRGRQWRRHFAVMSRGRG